MRVEERDILKKCGKGNPFTVPEGYFDSFATDLMNKLPEKDIPELSSDSVSIGVRLKPLFYLAASFVGLIIMIKALLFVSTGSKTSNSASQSSETVAEKTHNTKSTDTIYSDEDLEIILDHTMLDDYGVYQLVSDAH